MHPARNYTFDDLFLNLEDRVNQGLIKTSNKGDLRLYNYSESCVYDRKWDAFTLMARGLILDVVNRKIVATPFPKFFNFGEMGNSIPDLPFEAYEKLDGSMIILFYYDGRWQTATRGSFYSDQARWVETYLCTEYTDYCINKTLKKDTTYIFEAIYPANKIVVKYTTRQPLVILGGYKENGEEITYSDMLQIESDLQIDSPIVYKFNSFADLVNHAPTITRNEEGFVVRFQDGTRVKVKGDEYKRVHAMISNLSPLSIWNSMFAGDDLETIRRELPEEFWSDFDQMHEILDNTYNTTALEINSIVVKHVDRSPKEIVLDNSIPQEYKSYIFNAKKFNGNFLGGKGRETLFKSIRPDGNTLPGYLTSKQLEQAIAQN